MHGFGTLLAQTFFKIHFCCLLRLKYLGILVWHRAVILSFTSSFSIFRANWHYNKQNEPDSRNTAAPLVVNISFTSRPKDKLVC